MAFHKLTQRETKTGWANYRPHLAHQGFGSGLQDCHPHGAMGPALLMGVAGTTSLWPLMGAGGSRWYPCLQAPLGWEWGTVANGSFRGGTRRWRQSAEPSILPSSKDVVLATSGSSTGPGQAYPAPGVLLQVSGARPEPAPMPWAPCHTPNPSCTPPPALNPLPHYTLHPNPLPWDPSCTPHSLPTLCPSPVFIALHAISPPRCGPWAKKLAHPLIRDWMLQIVIAEPFLFFLCTFTRPAGEIKQNLRERTSSIFVLRLWGIAAHSFPPSLPPSIPHWIVYNSFPLLLRGWGDYLGE